MKKLISNFFKKNPAGRWFAKNEPYQTSLSDQYNYRDFCLQACSNDDLFENFRRNPVYIDVLEHVSMDQGNEYLKIIKQDAEVFNHLEQLKINDLYGNPIIYEYPTVGTFSPTTLRYIKVLVDLKNLFGTLDEMSVCEIGVGYGGQCRVINSFFKPAEYNLIDINSALKLAEKYLDNFNIASSLIFKEMDELEPKKYDLVISNYAFSELRRAIQNVYFEKIISSSNRGYMTYNEITPQAYNSYKKEELLEIIPNSKIIAEFPLTHPQNCIIVWGDDTSS